MLLPRHVMPCQPLAAGRPYFDAVYACRLRDDYCRHDAATDYAAFALLRCCIRAATTPDTLMLTPLILRHTPPFDYAAGYAVDTRYRYCTVIYSAAS